VRGASRVVRARALDTLDTSPGALVSPARSVRGINHTRYTGYSSFLKKPRSSQRVVRRGWCAPVHSTPLTPPLVLWSAQLDQSEASITHGTLDIRAFFKNLEVHNAWCVAGGARPCTRHLLYLTPGAGFSPARSGRGTQSCFNHTLYTGYSSFKKKPRSSACTASDP